MKKRRSKKPSTVNTRIEDAALPPKKTALSNNRTQAISMPKDTGRVLSPVPLKVFLVACGIKSDQTAGFAAYVKRMKFGPRTMPEWQRSFDEFMQKPTG